MTGDTLARVFRGLLHHDTFELFVSPSIADLQHAPGVQAYVAAWRSFLAALGEDLVVDTQLLGDEIALIFGLVMMQVCYYGGMLLLLVAHVRTDQMVERLANGAAPAVGLTFMCVVMASIVPTLVCFWPPRRTVDV